LHSTLVVGDDLYLWFSWTDSHVFLCSAGGSRGHLQKAPEFNRLCGELFSTFANVDQPSWTTRSSSWTAQSSSCDGSSQVCLALLIAMFSHLPPFTPTMCIALLAARGKEGTSIITGHDWLPFCSSLTHCLRLASRARRAALADRRLQHGPSSTTCKDACLRPTPFLSWTMFLLRR